MLPYGAVYRLGKLLAMKTPINPPKILSIGIIVFLIIVPLFMATALSLQLTTTTEYTSYVHNFQTSQGNYTYIEKPVFPVQINKTQIQIGQNWTIICPLQAGHNYHVYCYGAWINTSSAAATDYDFYVYDPSGNLIGTHTESAGLPPHLGTTIDDPLFTPTQSGNYSFVIENNAFDSKGAQAATFMIIENLQTDQWYSNYVAGNEQQNDSFNRCWSYEFLTNASYMELYVSVPQSLDMYEARLYLMNNAQSLTLNGYPLPWELGLYGNVSSSVGGYNFQSDGYRGVAYASCETYGQAMFLNYTAPSKGLNLYQLVFIGEQGTGNIQFMVKTKFSNQTLTPIVTPRRVIPNNATEISYSSNNTLLNAQLSYTVDNWTNTAKMDMVISNQTCNATIPGQIAGSVVQYKITAEDILQNGMATAGNYTVKEPLMLNITVVDDKVRLGENVTVSGVENPVQNSSIVQLQFSNANSTKTANCHVQSDGTFTANYKLPASGVWYVSASTNETSIAYRGNSEPLMVTILEPPIYVKYSMFIIIGLVGAMGAGVAVWFLRFRNK